MNILREMKEKIGMSMAGKFSGLSTKRFMKRMKLFAIAVYQMIWPGCTVNDLRVDVGARSIF